MHTRGKKEYKRGRNYNDNQQEMEGNGLQKEA